MNELLLDLDQNLTAHIRLSLGALAIGIGISIPAAVFVAPHARLRYGVLSVVSVIQTIPALALLALMVPIFVALTGDGLGFWPALTALVLYSMLPIVRNTLTGLAGVDADVIEAARAMGMTPVQSMLRVRLPLAAPVILAGVRTAAVWTVGIATLATPVGQRCLGNFIFTGLQTQNWTSVLVGCAAAAALAIVLDTLLGGVELGLRRRRPPLLWACAAAIAVMFGVGLGGPYAKPAGPVSGPTLVVGAKTFTEQYILADVIGGVCEDAGYRVEGMESLGSAVVFEGLASGEIDVYVDYSGTIWANHMKRTDTADAQTVLDEVSRWVRETHGVVCLGSLGFENAYGMAMRRDRAEAVGATSIDDLRGEPVSIGGDYEFFERPEWDAIRSAYSLTPSETISYDSTFMYEAVATGQVDVISAFTSDGRIAAFDLVVLDDPRGVIPPYDAVLLVSADASQDEDLIEALRPLVGSIDVEMMREANLMVDRDEDKRSVAEAAAWLRERIATDGESGR